MLAVLLQRNHLAVLQLQLAIILQAANLHKEGFGRLQITRQIDALSFADGAHVVGEDLVVVVEPLDFWLTQRLLHIAGNGRSVLPTNVLDPLQSLIEECEQAPLVPLQGGMSEAQNGQQLSIASGGADAPETEMSE